MTDENEVLKAIVMKLFPSATLYENDVPTEFKRPCFVFIEPGDRTDTKELTKAILKVSRTIPLYGFYEEDNSSQGKEMQQKLLEYLMRDKKHLIPDSDRRYLTLDSCSVNDNTADFFLEFSICFSRTVMRNMSRSEATPIRHIVHNINGRSTEHEG